MDATRPLPAGGKSPPSIKPLLLVFGVAVLAYAGTLSADFTNWDDPATVVENTAIRGFSWRNIVSWWLDPVFELVPFSDATYALDYEFWGLRPLGFHLTNILLHGLCTVLVWRLSFGLGANLRAATLAALIFALHPASAEVVSWVSQRRTLLAAPLMLAALLAYLSAEGKGAWKPGLLCVVFFALSLLSKNVSATPFPIILIPLHWATGIRLTKARLAAALVSLVAAVGAGLFRFHTDASLETFRGLFGGSIGSHASAIAVEFSRYCTRLLFPVQLSPYYDLRQEDITLAAVTLGAALAAGGLIALLRLLLRRRPAAFLASGALLFWLPSSSIIVPFAIPAADRYLYLPLLFLSPLVAVPLERFLRRNSRPAAGFVMVAILLMMGVLTVRQSTYWRSSVSLWSRAVQVEPENPWVRQKLAYTLWKQGDAQGALVHAERAAAIEPGWMEGLETLGRVALDAGAPERAERAFRQQIGIAPNAVNAYVGLGRARSALGDDQEAFEAYLEALRLKRDLRDAAVGLYDLAVRNGWEVKALSSLPAKPTSAWLDLVRGDLLARTGRPEEARRMWRRILVARPGFAPASERLRAAEGARQKDLTGAGPSE